MTHREFRIGHAGEISQPRFGRRAHGCRRLPGCCALHTPPEARGAEFVAVAVGANLSWSMAPPSIENERQETGATMSGRPKFRGRTPRGPASRGPGASPAATTGSPHGAETKALGRPPVCRVGAEALLPGDGRPGWCPSFVNGECPRAGLGRRARFNCLANTRCLTTHSRSLALMFTRSWSLWAMA